jgi:hypothetical protein
MTEPRVATGERGGRATSVPRHPVARLGVALALALAAVAAYLAVPSPKDPPGWRLVCLCGLGLLVLSTLMSRLVLRYFFAPADSEVLLTAIFVSVLLFGIATALSALVTAGPAGVRTAPGGARAGGAPPP